MSEKPFTGLTAKVTKGGNPIAYLSGFDLTLDQTIIDILQFGATYKEKVPAIRDWTGSVDGTAAFAADGSQNDLIDAAQNGTALTIGIYLDDDTYFTGTAYISSVNINGAPDDKINITAEFSGSGAVVFTVPT